MYQKHLLLLLLIKRNKEKKEGLNNQNNDIINNLIRANKKKARETKEKVYKAIKELKAKHKKITTVSVMRLANVSKGSARKYMQQAKEEGIL